LFQNFAERSPMTILFTGLGIVQVIWEPGFVICLLISVDSHLTLWCMFAKFDKAPTSPNHCPSERDTVMGPTNCQDPYLDLTSQAHPQYKKEYLKST
jgi:hypothetical protein